jgi:hypothetical protein
MKRTLIAGLAALLAIGMVAWWYSPTQVLKRRSAGLVDSLTFSGGTGIPARQLSGYSFGAFLADEVELDSHGIDEADGTFSRTTLESAHAALASYARESGFKIEDFHFVNVDGELGHVSLTIDGFVELPDYRPADGRYLVDFYWRRSDAGWHLYRAVWREAR